jgi:hypothetical protein
MLQVHRLIFAALEGVGVDADGNVYGAVVRRQMLEKHIPQTSNTPPGK